MSRIIRRSLWIGLLAFLVFIGTAAALYPGGNRFDRTSPGFSLAGNFLCDLFDRHGYNGILNPGRPFAVTSAYIFAVTLFLFWNALPRLFDSKLKHARFVRVLGSVAMVVTLFIATPLHDWCVNISVPLAVIAFGFSIDALRKSGEVTLARLGLLSATICVLNYLSLVFRFFPETLPGLQKITLCGFLLWMIACIQRLKKINEGP